MNIIHFISSPAAGGAETYVKDLAIAIARNGHSVTVVFLSCARDAGRCERFEADYLAELSNNRIDYFFIGNKCRQNIILGVIRFRSLVKCIKPDIVHCHLYYGLVFAFFSGSTCLIYTHHNIRLGVSRHFYKISNFFVKAYIGICEPCHQLLTSSTNRSVTLINNAVSVQRIIKRSSHDSPRTCLQFVAVGRLSLQKNYPMLLKAVKKLEALDFKLLIAGEGELNKELDRMLHELDIREKVQFLGNRTDINQILSESDVFVMTSDWEGLPISLIEATLTGLPCVVTDVGGCKDFVDVVQNGIVVPAGDVDAFAAALKKLILDRAFRESMANNASKNSTLFTMEHCCSEHLTLYQKCLSTMKHD